MAVFSVREVLLATRGQVRMSGPAVAFTGVSTDTRTLQPGELFVAIRGERFDGHAFLEQAKAMGAAGVLVEDTVPGTHRGEPKFGDWHVIEVTDTLYALGQLAQHHRRRFRIPVVGITGSAGKTTTKEMTAAILEQGHTVLKSQGNFNNEIGLPLTLFTLDDSHKAAVLEFGMRGRGQIGYLAAVARPTVGIITNIGITHLELLGSQEQIALAKAELLDEMPATGVAVLPARDDFFPLLREHAKGTVVTVGDTPDCDYRISDMALADGGCARFTLHGPELELPIALSAPGHHQVWNALAAAAAALTAGAKPEDVQAGLAAYQPLKGRMQAVRAPGGFTVIDDTYNANPTAMRATLEFLAQVPGNRKMAILGDMLELGPSEHEIHREIGRYAASLGIDALIAIGELGKEYAAGAGDTAQWFPAHASAAAAALALLQPGDVVLIKGSRGMRMELVVERLVAE
ncbi:MAG: UDP-N-acetylmuramoyl-tripeptide--D-alanyl-D-alanine ligase [Armatimonadota bacterium]